MADILILRRHPEQKHPRPINRACSRDELVDLLTMGRRPLLRADELKLENIDTDRPIAVRAGDEFFAFTEEQY